MQFNADGTFESYFGERLQNGLQRVMEKHCGKETGAMADAITTCQKKHGSDPEAFSRCLEPPAIRFGQCVESAQTKLFGPMESHPKFEKIRHCITLGDGAPKKCWKIADQFLESLMPESKYPAHTPNVDRMIQVAEKLQAQQPQWQ